MPIVRLTTCDNVIEANFIKNNLENEGVECFLTNEISSTLLPGYTGIMNADIQVMIEDKDFERAILLIYKEINDNQILCTGCCSTNVTLSFGDRKILKYLLVFFSLFAFTPFGNIQRKYVCNDCKTEF